MTAWACTPGHMRVFQEATGVNPVFAQQSTREMGRTHRAPRNVLDDATWGAFQGGWTGGVGDGPSEGSGSGPVIDRHHA